MKIQELIDKLDLKIFNKHINQDIEVTGGYVGDLLSHVMGNSDEGEAWITVQTHKNVLAIASLNDLSAVILIDSQVPDADMLEVAEDEQIPVLGSDKSAFYIAGELYKLI
ncbi:MAG: hypothetical protein KAG96_03020 [Ichthyobacteriaceae bacterium]|nr:hypothetical protein [Ichthyobacteriaceae bacterium]